MKVIYTALKLLLPCPGIPSIRILFHQTRLVAAEDVGYQQHHFSRVSLSGFRLKDLLYFDESPFQLLNLSCFVSGIKCQNFRLRPSPGNMSSSHFGRLSTLLAHILRRKFLFWCLLSLEKVLQELCCIVFLQVYQFVLLSVGSRYQLLKRQTADSVSFTVFFAAWYTSNSSISSSDARFSFWSTFAASCFRL